MWITENEVEHNNQNPVSWFLLNSNQSLCTQRWVFNIHLSILYFFLVLHIKIKAQYCLSENNSTYLRCCHLHISHEVLKDLPACPSKIADHGRHPLVIRCDECRRSSTTKQVCLIFSDCAYL